MLKNSFPKSGFFTFRCLLAVSLCLNGAYFSVLSSAAMLHDNYSIGRRHVSLGPTATPSGPSGPGWSIVTPPPESNYANAVTCSSHVSCWAVGIGPSIEHWNGSEWTVVPSANLGANQSAALTAVACISDSDCWAAGNLNTGRFQTLIEHWDGGSWSVTPSPSVAFQDNILAGIACASSSDCWAVGYYASHQTLVEHWDGTTWTIVPSANVDGASGNLLYGVTCPSSSDCWAVGYYAGTNYGPQTLVEHWDGSSWSIVTSPNLGLYQNFLNGVACTSSSQCFAVGFYAVGNVYRTLIEQWNGSAWSVSDSPNTSATLNNALYGVDCRSASDCWSVG